MGREGRKERLVMIFNSSGTCIGIIAYIRAVGKRSLASVLQIKQLTARVYQ